MYSTEEKTRFRDHLLAAIARSAAEANSEDQSFGSFVVTVRDIDLPATVSEGVVYVQIPLEGICNAIEAGVSALIRSVEAGVPEAWSATLAFTPDGGPVPGAYLAVEGLVRDRGEW